MTKEPTIKLPVRYDATKDRLHSGDTAIARLDGLFLSETERLGIGSQIVNALNNAPDAWIPTSERLPDASGYYCATLRSGDFNKDVEVAYFHYSPKEWSRVFGSPTHQYFGTGVVTAWRPLPQPYVAKQEGKSDALEQGGDAP